MVLPESQCEFRRSRSTIDMIFTLRQLQKKAVEQQQRLDIVFIDLLKAFDTVDRSKLWTLLRRYGCPLTFVKITKQFHAGAVSIGESTTDPFEISHGLKEGYVLAPTLFTLFLAAILSTVSEHIRQVLFKLPRLKASITPRELCIRELLFPDAVAIFVHTLEDTLNICKAV